MDAKVGHRLKKANDQKSSDVVMVLGMHRSGTSAVAGVLTKLGGGLPKHLMAADSGNERGYFESVAFMRFHDDLLASAGSDWRDWRLFNPGWHRSPVVADFRRRAKDLFAEVFDGAALPVLKDPRMCRFVPFWLDVLDDMQALPHIVMPIRSPLDVAQSLKLLHGLSLNHGLVLWLRHVLDAEAQSRTVARSIFSWHDFQSNWRGVCEKIAAETELSWPRLSDRTSREIERFLAKELVHHDTDHATLAAHADVHEWTLRTYEALLELARNPLSSSALAGLDDVRALFDQSSKVFGRLLIDYEIDLEDVRGRALAATSERDALRTLQSEISAENAAAVAEIAARAEAAEAAREDAAQEKEALAHSLAAALAERDALGAAVAELAARAEAAEAACEDAAQEKEALGRSLAAALAERDALGASHEEIATELQSQRRELAEKAAAMAKLGARAEAAEKAREEDARHRDTLLQRLSASDAECGALLMENARIAAELQSRRQEIAQSLKAHEAQNHALRGQLVDAEAALANLTAKQSRPGILAGVRPTAVRRRRLARQLVRSGLLDASWYKATYPDVAESGLGPAEHYLEKGFCRGYRPNPLFDTHWYLEHYEDVRRSGVNPLLHYITNGYREGRDPGPDFHTEYYLEANPDIRANGMNPLTHYLRFGRDEGRLPKRPAVVRRGLR
jgi:hypothetical protein